MSKKKTKKKKIKSISNSKLVKEVMAQTTELLGSYSNFAAKIEDYTSQNLYEEDYSEIKESEAARIRTAVERYVKLLIGVSKLFEEGLDG